VGQSFTVVQAEGGVLGSFGGIAQPAAGLLPGSRFDALYGPSSLTLVVTPASYGNLGLLGLPESDSQAAIGTALDAARPVAGVVMSPAQSVIYTPLYGLPAGSIAATLDQLSPTIYGDGLITARDSWYLVSGAIADHLYAARGNPTPAGILMAPNALGGTVWMTGLAQFGDTGANNAPGYNATTPGVALGADVPLTGDLTAGIALGYTTPQTSAKNAASLSGDTLVVQAYAAWQSGIAFAEAYAGGMAVEGNSTRPLGIYGAEARGVTGGPAGGGAVRAGLRLDLSGWAIEPNLGLAGVSLHQPPLTETAAGPLSLAIASSSVASIRSLVGVRAATRIDVSPDAVIVPTLQLGWSHEYADQHAQTFATFTGAPATAFSVSSSATGRDAAIVGAGADIHLSAPVSLYAAYRGEFRGGSSAQQVTGGLRFVW
jgi:outer membrane autotransporter protein